MGEDHSNVQRMVETSLNTAGDESINSLIENYSDKMPSTAITNGGVSYEELLSLAPIEYAPTARVKQGKLRLAQQSLNLPIVTLDQLEVLRIDHLEEAKLSRIEAGNLSSGFNRRLSSVILLLSEPLTDDSSLRLANQVSALAAMRATIMEELTPISAVNFTSFIDQLVLYCNKFPSWRTFTALESSSATTNEVSSIAATLLNNRNLVVSQDIQDALTEAVETSGDVNKSGQVYFEGLVHNVFSEAGRYILARAKGISSGFNEKLDKEIGEGLAVGLSNLLIAASTPLLALAVQLPATWAWAGPAIAAARVVLGRR
ncbi:MAG: hypothetical protein EOO61_09305 [Hymenobacter sp.]|nr:MAG: hypothetical protein EOO61_09305 [Hymenobacter sp.]